MQVFESFHHHLSYDHLVFLVLLKRRQKKNTQHAKMNTQFVYVNVQLIVIITGITIFYQIVTAILNSNTVQYSKL